MYIYDLHAHSCECSACGVSTAKQMVAAYKGIGFSGFVLTNHFYHGNTCISRQLDWKNFVQKYYDAYLYAKEEGDKEGIDVLFGLEEYVGESKEYLIYNIDLPFLKEAEFLRDADAKQLCDAVKSAGGFLSFAHPYRFRDYMGRFIEPHFGLTDAVEVFNAANTEDENKKALLAAENGGFYMTCGSDSHSVQDVINRKTGLAFKNRVTNGKQLIEEIKSADTRRYIFGKTV